MSERHIMLLFSSPVEGMEDAYHQWYSSVHLDEVVKSSGFVAAQRFVVSGPVPEALGQHRFLALYEIEGDLDAARATLAADRVVRSEMPSALDPDVTQIWLSAITPRVVEP